MDVLRYEDHVWGDDYYRRAAESTIRIYLHLYDNPSITAGEQEPDYSGMTAAQKKKAKAVARKKKKAAEKKAAEAAEKQNEQEPKENGNKSSKKNQPEVVKDTDPDGLELLKKDPLEEANKYSSMLALHAPNELSTWILRYDVAIRRGKALIAMQVRRSFRCDCFRRFSSVASQSHLCSSFRCRPCSKHALLMLKAANCLLVLWTLRRKRMD